MLPVHRSFAEKGTILRGKWRAISNDLCPATSSGSYGRTSERSTNVERSFRAEGASENCGFWYYSNCTLVVNVPYDKLYLRIRSTVTVLLVPKSKIFARYAIRSTQTFRKRKFFARAFGAKGNPIYTNFPKTKLFRSRLRREGQSDLHKLSESETFSNEFRRETQRQVFMVTIPERHRF